MSQGRVFRGSSGPTPSAWPCPGRQALRLWVTTRGGDRCRPSARRSRALCEAVGARRVLSTARELNTTVARVLHVRKLRLRGIN